MKAVKASCRFFAIAILILVTSACTEPGEETIYAVGDVVGVGYDLTMVLTSAEFTDDVLEATFTIENNGTEDRTFNLWLSLQARDTEGTPIGQLVPCGSNMDGTLHPGDQATGVICWSCETEETVRIHFINMIFNSNIAWEVSR